MVRRKVYEQSRSGRRRVGQLRESSHRLPRSCGGGFGRLENYCIASCDSKHNCSESKDIWCIPKSARSVMKCVLLKEVPYQGAIPRMTPYGSFQTIALFPSAPGIGTLPWKDGILPATSFNMSTASGTLKPEPQNSDAAVSSIIYFPSSSPRFSTIFAALRKISRLAVGLVFFQLWKAFCADSTAVKASATEALVESWRRLPVTGDRTGKEASK